MNPIDRIYTDLGDAATLASYWHLMGGSCPGFRLTTEESGL